MKGNVRDDLAGLVSLLLILALASIPGRLIFDDPSWVILGVSTLATLVILILVVMFIIYVGDSSLKQTTRKLVRSRRVQWAVAVGMVVLIASLFFRI